jgi:hypothetical protein
MKRPRTSSATYVYCVACGDRPPALARAPSGLPGTGPSRSIEVSGCMWLVVGDAPLDRYDEAGIKEGLRDLEWVGECAAGHERIVEYTARNSTTVPMKLFTLFADDERAAANARKLSARIARVAERIDGCEEWGVRVHLDERRVRAAARKRAAAQTARAAVGTSFLRAKKAQQTGVYEAVGVARGEADSAFAELAGRARESIERPPVSREIAARVLLDAVFLVPSKRARAFQSAVKRVQTSLSKGGCDLTLSGPWPPYHFVDVGRRSKK